MRYISHLLVIIAIAVMATACDSSKKVIYLQDAEVNKPAEITNSQVITIEPKDMLSIVVSSSDAKLSKIFNLPIATTQAGTDHASLGQYLMGYAVDNDGFIDFPVLGKVRAAGFNRWQLQGMIQKELLDRKLLNDAIVTVDFRCRLWVR